MPTTGDKPGKGIYACVHEGETVELQDDSTALPKCPHCGGSEFLKVPEHKLEDAQAKP